LNYFYLSLELKLKILFLVLYINADKKSIPDLFMKKYSDDESIERKLQGGYSKEINLASIRS